jgi:hypothetical protein
MVETIAADNGAGDRAEFYDNEVTGWAMRRVTDRAAELRIPKTAIREAEEAKRIYARDFPFAYLPAIFDTAADFRARKRTTYVKAFARIMQTLMGTDPASRIAASYPPNEDADVTIRFTPEDGVTFDAARIWNDAIKADPRSRYSPRVGWYIQGSRGNDFPAATVFKIAEALKDAGAVVEVLVEGTDDDARYLQGRLQAARDAAERAGARAERKSAESSAQYGRARSATERIEPGQPVHVGHHSEGQHRRAIERHDSAMRRSIEAERAARAASEREASADKRAAAIEREMEAQAAGYTTQTSLDGDAAMRGAVNRIGVLLRRMGFSQWNSYNGRSGGVSYQAREYRRGADGMGLRGVGTSPVKVYVDRGMRNEYSENITPATYTAEPGESTEVFAARVVSGSVK